jgi:Eukaryotic aspartyl protease
MGNGYGYILITDSQDNSFGILGDVFMRNFYVVFDNGNMKFGFAPLINAPETKPALVAGSTPKCSYTTYGTSLCDASSASSSEGLSITETIIIVIVALVIIGVIAYLTIEVFL